MDTLIDPMPPATPTHSIIMKANLAKCVAVMAVMAASGHAQTTIDWGSEAFSNLVDSHGNPLVEGTYQFELGAFNPGFTPTQNNLADWFTNWHLVDTAAYNKDNGYFTGILTSAEIAAKVDPAFVGKQAYLWIRNSESMVKWGGDEWLLVSDPTWILPPSTFPPPSTNVATTHRPSSGR